MHIVSLHTERIVSLDTVNIVRLHTVQIVPQHPLEYFYFSVPSLYHISFLHRLMFRVYIIARYHPALCLLLPMHFIILYYVSILYTSSFSTRSMFFYIS